MNDVVNNEIVNIKLLKYLLFSVVERVCSISCFLLLMLKIVSIDFKPRKHKEDVDILLSRKSKCYQN